MENKQQPVVNICGSCILRDTFYYQGVYGKEKDGGYRINRTSSLRWHWNSRPFRFMTGQPMKHLI